MGNSCSRNRSPRKRYNVYLCRKKFHPYESLSARSWLEFYSNDDDEVSITSMDGDLPQKYFRIRAGEVHRSEEDIEEVLKEEDVLLILQRLGLPHTYEVRLCRKERRVDNRQGNSGSIKGFHVWIELINTRNPTQVRELHFSTRNTEARDGSFFEDRVYKNKCWICGTVAKIVGYTDQPLLAIQAEGKKIAKLVGSSFFKCGVGCCFTNCRTFCEKLLLYLDSGIDTKQAFLDLHAYSGTIQGRNKVIKGALKGAGYGAIGGTIVGAVGGTLLVTIGAVMLVQLVNPALDGIGAGLICLGLGTVGAGTVSGTALGMATGGIALTSIAVVGSATKEHVRPQIDPKKGSAYFGVKSHKDKSFKDCVIMKPKLYRPAQFNCFKMSMEEFSTCDSYKLCMMMGKTKIKVLGGEREEFCECNFRNCLFVDAEDL